MKHIIAISLILAGSGAFAQSQAASQAQANVAVGSQSGAAVIQTFTGTPKTTTEYRGAYDVRNVPSVSAPGVITANVCALGTSAGVSGLGGGISFGKSYIDPSCANIQEANALNILLGADIAVLHLAKGNPSICRTLRSAGKIPAESNCGDAKPVIFGGRISTRNTPVTVVSTGFEGR